MHSISLPDPVYEQAQRAAAASGVSINAYVAGLVAQSVQVDLDDQDHLFTPEVIAELAVVVAELDAGGKIYSENEVDAHFVEKRTRQS